MLVEDFYELSHRFKLEHSWVPRAIAADFPVIHKRQMNHRLHIALSLRQTHLRMSTVHHNLVASFAKSRWCAVGSGYEKLYSAQARPNCSPCGHSESVQDRDLARAHDERTHINGRVPLRMQTIVGDRECCVAGARVPLRACKEGWDLQVGVVRDVGIVEIPLRDSTTGVPLDMQEYFIPVVPLELRASDTLDVRIAIITTHNAHGHSHILRPDDTAHDRIIGLDVERYVCELLRAGGHGVAIVVELQEPVPLPGGGRKRRFPAKTARRDCRRGGEHNGCAQPDFIRLGIPLLPRLPQVNASAAGRLRSVRGGSSGQTGSL